MTTSYAHSVVHGTAVLWQPLTIRSKIGLNKGIRAPLTIRNKMGLSRGIKAPLIIKNKTGLSGGIAWAAIKKTNITVFR